VCDESTVSVTCEQLQARLRANLGSVYDRVLFYPRLPNSEQFMQFISVADVLLHPFPFDGSKTAADGIAMGIPVVTWPQVCVSAPRVRRQSASLC
jgi:predicted O-linked N-acetylglucosamine transferase (SPINDLY family)